MNMSKEKRWTSTPKSRPTFGGSLGRDVTSGLDNRAKFLWKVTFFCALGDEWVLGMEGGIPGGEEDMQLGERWEVESKVYGVCAHTACRMTGQ